MYDIDSNPEPSELDNALLTIYKDFRQEDQSDRDNLLRVLRKLDLYWHGIQDIYYDYVTRDYKVAAREQEEKKTPKIVNIYRSFLESIIAALSASLPAGRFFPKNADNPFDVSTAKAYSRIADYIQLQNDAPLLLAKALFVLCNQHFVAAYTHYEKSFEFGTISVPIEGPVDKVIPGPSFCENCAEEVEPMGTIDGMDMCPNCGDSNLISDTEVVTETEVIGEEDYPAGRETIDIYGPMHVQIPQFAAKQERIPVLFLHEEFHFTDLMNIYPEYKEQIRKSASNVGDEERETRKPVTSLFLENPIRTLTRAWIRPWALLRDDQNGSALREQYPNGILLHIIDDKIVKKESESLDEHWTISETPLAKSLHAEPIGNSLVDIQDIETDMVNITLDSIRYGIPFTFAESSILDWDAFANSKSEPGAVYPTKPAPNKNLRDAFYTPITATLSQEVDRFSRANTERGQFVSGAFPATYGGPSSGGSGTFREYEMSRNQALQRLSIVWKVIQKWWRKTMRKAVKEYRANMITDESFAQELGGSFVNVWIRRSEMAGEIGEVEAEVSDQFPISSIQKRGLLLELMTMGLQELNSVIFSPANAGLISRVLGFSEIVIPGEADRTKQLFEIMELIKQEPVPSMGPMGQIIPAPSIPVDPLVDNHQVHAEMLREWLVSEVGREVKEMNEAGYQNVVMHLQQHEMIIQQQMMQQAAMQQEQPNKPEDKQVPGEPPVKEPPAKDKGVE